MWDKVFKNILLNLWKTAFKMFETIWSVHHFKFFKGCLSQILLGPFLNALSQIKITINFFNK